MIKVFSWTGILFAFAVGLVSLLAYVLYRKDQATTSLKKDLGCEYYRGTSLKEVPVECVQHFFADDAGKHSPAQRIFYCVDSPMCKDWKSDDPPMLP